MRPIVLVTAVRSGAGGGPLLGCDGPVNRESALAREWLRLTCASYVAVLGLEQLPQLLA
jgi:hypothetical protein